MKIQITASLVIIVVMFSCNSKEKESSAADTTSSHATGHGGHHMPGMDERTKELMALHDSIMPSTETIMNLKREVSTEIKKADSLIAVKPSSTSKQLKEQALRINDKLEVAYQQMMGWMHQYKADSLESLDSAQAAAYIKDQKLKLEMVRDQMKASISEAESFVQKSSR